MTKPPSTPIHKLLDELKAEIVKSNREFAIAYTGAQSHNEHAPEGAALASYPDYPSWVPVATAVLQTLERVNPDRAASASIARQPRPDFMQALDLGRDPGRPISSRSNDYLELPLSQRSPTIDRLLQTSQLSQLAPRTETLMRRHLRLKLIETDLYDQLAEYIVPPNDEHREYFRAGHEHVTRRIERAQALIQENSRQAVPLMTVAAERIEPTKLADRLRQRIAWARHEIRNRPHPEMDFDRF